MKRALVIPDRVRIFLELDRKGSLVWAVQRGNRARGTLAGSVRKSGYRIVNVEGKTYAAHRLVWFLHHNEQPPSLVDHIDGDPLNNHPDNLRAASRAQNSQNRKISANNTSGVSGVAWDKHQSKWRVRIQVDGGVKDYGSYRDFKQAAKVAEDARSRLHGEFAR